MTLNARRRAFIVEYMKDFNATAAAIRAGYAERTAYSQGSRLLKNVEVAAAIADRMAKRAMDADEVLERLGDMARGDMDDFVSPVEGASYVALVDYKKAQATGKTHLIKKLKYDPDRGLEIELYDAQRALELIGKHHKLFTDKVEHSGAVAFTWEQAVEQARREQDGDDADHD